MEELGHEFRQHLGKRQYELLEDDWLELLEKNPSPAEMLDLSELAVLHAPPGTPIILLRVLADWLKDKSEHRWRLRALRRLHELGDKDASLPAGIADCYRRMHEKSDLVERLLQKAGLGYGEKLSDALTAFEGYVKLLPGSVVLDGEIGPARVKKLDLLLSRVTIAGDDGRELVLDLTAADSRIRAVQPGGFFELLLTDRAGLLVAVQEDPGRVVRQLLEDLRRPLGVQVIREQLAGVVPDGSWDGFWNRARRDLDQHPHVRNVSRPSRGFQWSDLPVEKKTAHGTTTRTRGLVVELDKAAVMARPLLLRVYADQTTLANRRQLIETVETARPGDAAELLADMFCTGRDGRARNIIEERLRRLAPKTWHKLVARVLTSYRQVPDAFTWVAENSARLEDVEARAVLTRLLDLLESPDFKALATALRRSLVADSYRLVDVSLGRFDAAGARRLLDRLDRIHGIEAYRRDELTELITARFPELAAPADADVVLTTAAGLAQARAELNRLTREELPRAAEELAAARSHGDLSENYEYKAAKEKRARLMGQVQRLQAELARTRTILPQEVKCDRVAAGCRVRIEDDAGVTVEYSLLGPWDSNPDAGAISYLAPLGQAMLGRAAGETFEFDDRFYTVRTIKPASLD